MVCSNHQGVGLAYSYDSIFPMNSEYTKSNTTLNRNQFFLINLNILTSQKIKSK